MTSAGTHTSGFTQADLATFGQFGIPLEQLTGTVRRVTDQEARDALNSRHSGDLAGILFQYYDPESRQPATCRLRRDHPEVENGKAKDKYLAPYGDHRHLFFTPGAGALLADTSVTVVFVEAEKSSLAFTAAASRAGRRLLAIGTGGCWGWRGAIGKTVDAGGARVDEKGPLPDLSRVAWGDRNVVLLFDANATTNTKVRAARRALASELAGRGAKVRIANLPVEPGINGPDDYRAAHGDAPLLALIDQARPAGDNDHARTVTLTPASSIKVRPVRWLWQDRVPLGTFALMAGREGVGKTILAYTLTAQVTQGTLPGAYAGLPRSVVIAATEDSWEYTIVPRLMVAGADLDRVFRVDVVTRDGMGTTISLPRDLPALGHAIRDQQVALVILDPLLSRLDAALDTHKDAEVRLALEPLVTLANVTDTCVLGLIHCNKSSSADALTLVMASRAFVAVARAVLFVMTDPEDDTRRLLGQPKNNLGRSDLPSLMFTIEGAHVTDTAEGEVWTGKLFWAGQTDRSIRDAVEEAAENAGDRTATGEAADWLHDYLTSQGGTAESAAIKREGGKAGHSADALKRARRRLSIVSDGRGFPRRTYWVLRQLEQSKRGTVGAKPGETLCTALAAPTVDTGAQLEQSEQSEQSGETPRAREGGGRYGF